MRQRQSLNCDLDRNLIMSQKKQVFALFDKEKAQSPNCSIALNNHSRVKFCHYIIRKTTKQGTNVENYQGSSLHCNSVGDNVLPF